jgi:hypothetical protein
MTEIDIFSDFTLVTKMIVVSFVIYGYHVEPWRSSSLENYLEVDRSTQYDVRSHFLSLKKVGKETGIFVIPSMARLQVGFLLDM